MNKNSARSLGTIKSVKSKSQWADDVDVPPLDVLVVKVYSLKLTNEDHRQYAIRVTFMDQALINTVIDPVTARGDVSEIPVARGSMSYDPADYEKMSLFGDNPLVVLVYPVEIMGSLQEKRSVIPTSPNNSTPSRSDDRSPSPSARSQVEDSCCNIDILALFKDVDNLRVEKRMQPLIEPPVLECKSWDNLPLVTMEIKVIRNSLNEQHHILIKDANVFQLTLIAAVNVISPYSDAMTYTAASKTPVTFENVSDLLVFNKGYRCPEKRFNISRFRSKWESLRQVDGFANGDDMVTFKIQNLQNHDNIDIESYLVHVNRRHCVVWGSFHRHLMVINNNRQLRKHLCRYHWPLEFHINSDYGGYSFMGFMDLKRLLYPGETTVQLAVPLHWVNNSLMMEKCGCDLLLSANTRAPTTPTEVVVKTKGTAATDSPSSTITEGGLPRPTGADENCAFVIVEVRLAKPLVQPSIPPVITESQIRTMLSEMEGKYSKPVCTGRGQLVRDWKNTIRNAATSLRRVPYYGMTEFCAFNRQLSGTRTRIELTTSFWMEAAVYVNNNFVVQDYLLSDDTFEEMVMMAHVCLVRETCKTLVSPEIQDMNPTLRAARHSRQLLEIPHALDLYMQVVTESYNDANSWRELSTCLKDVDADMADVCINRSVELDPRHPLTLISKGSMLYEEDPDAAELFFTAVLALYPFWTTGWVIAKAFYIEKQEFYMADQISVLYKKTMAEGLAENLASQRSWEYELGDWWDHTPLLPGMSRNFDAADLLLRLRAMSLAEVCLGRALSEGGESAVYFHLVALSCRLRGDIAAATCHVQAALEAFGEVSYLRSLEGELYHQQKNRESALNSFEKSGNYAGPYRLLMASSNSTLTALPCRDPQRTRSVLVDLLRRQPSARAWMALAEDWLMRQATKGDAGDGAGEGEVAMASCAAACAAQALKWDRRCADAWGLLARLVRPRARRSFCRDMAAECGYVWSDAQLDALAESQESLCYRLSERLEACHCDLCEPIKS